MDDREGNRVQGLSPTDANVLLDAVLESNSGTPDPRLRQILEGLIRHLHAFAIETDITPAELEYGLNFLVQIGQATGPRKHEGILLADILGLATLVQLRGARHALHPTMAPPEDLAGRTVVITGGTGAIGTATAMRLAQSGARIVLLQHTKKRPVAEYLAQLPVTRSYRRRSRIAIH